jgi:hypothetical protein
MNDDMPWVNLTQEEVDQLRKQKHELTQYGKEKLRQLMNNQEPYPDEMFEEAERREKENKVLDIAKNIMEENKEAFQHLAAIERKEFAEKDFEDLTRDQKIQLALEEIDWIVIGGQDGEEFYNSIQFLRKVLRSLK